MIHSINFKSDGHVHTSLCHHAVGEMHDYVLAAIQNALEEIIFLEHFETGIEYFESTWLNNEEFSHYFETGQALQKKYKYKIKIGLGVEVGFNPNRIEQTIAFLEQFAWDRIGLSYHFYREGCRHINMLSRKKQNMDEFSTLGVQKVVSDYLKGLILGVKQLPINVLCHLDAVLRHHPEVAFLAEHNSLIEELLRELTIRNIALEINTSGYGHPRQMAYPHLWIIKKAQALRIQCVVGSDAHHPKEVGRHFTKLKDCLAL